MIDKYIQQHGQRLYGLCLHLCKNRSDADDLYQDTWLKVMKYIDKYRPDEAFEPWVTKICVNTYRNSLRRLMHSPIFDGFSSDEEKDYAMNSISATEPKDYTDLRNAIEKLPDKLRMVIILYYFQDMEVEKAARTLGIPPGTVKSRLSTARKQLKEVLSDGTDIPF